MSAQLVDTIEEIIMLDPDDSLVVVLCDGRVVEVFGDGTTQQRGPARHEVLVGAI